MIEIERKDVTVNRWKSVINKIWRESTKAEN
jgi:hypothetical protein